MPDSKNSKISELTELTAPVGSDIIPIVDSSDSETKKITYENLISGQTAEITTNTANIATNAANIASNAANIASNDTDISINSAYISTNTANIATNTADISTNTADISTNAANIATNAANIASNDTDIATNAANIASNDTDIASNTANIATNTTNIATNTANIASNDTDIATNAANIASNDTDIATNTANIATNTANINQKLEKANNLSDLTNVSAAAQNLGLGSGNDVLFASVELTSGARVNEIETTLTNDDAHIPTSGAVVDHLDEFANDPRFEERIRIAYEAPSTSSWWLQADTQARFSITESFSSEVYRTFVIDRFSNVEINTLTLAENNRYDTRSNPSYTTVREFQKSLISDDGVVPTSSAVQKYIAETSPITAITGTGGETYSRYKTGWTYVDVTAIDNSWGASSAIEAVRFGSEVDSIGSIIFKARAGLKFVDFGQIPLVSFEACRVCTDLERVIMRTSNQIGQSAFFGCTSLSDVDLGSVTDIGFNAFKNCTALESITIPASVTVLGNNVFDGCSSLSEVNCYADESVFDPNGGNVFRGTASPLVIHVKIESDWQTGTGLDFQGNTNVTVINDLV